MKNQPGSRWWWLLLGLLLGITIAFLGLRSLLAPEDDRTYQPQVGDVLCQPLQPTPLLLLQNLLGCGMFAEELQGIAVLQLSDEIAISVPRPGRGQDEINIGPVGHDQKNSFRVLLLNLFEDGLTFVSRQVNIYQNDVHRIALEKGTASGPSDAT